ncbi:MAG: hypothetical protein Q8O12_03290 [Candidatus Omnitrophota bacterium]|nr:hypothetical protein [Candidatus Omnitrophota bacterium]
MKLQHMFRLGMILLGVTGFVVVEGCSSSLCSRRAGLVEGGTSNVSNCAGERADLVGARGPAGSVGPQGERGLTGPKGASGVALRGVRGEMGPTGPAGERGLTGSRGPIGDVARGPVGVAGPRGDRGQQGQVGIRGEQGDSSAGFAGARGPVGSQGVRGPVGEAGVKGPTLYGPQGPAGYEGSSGEQGTIGGQGSKGNITAGIAGPVGPSGLSGSVGSMGATGGQGVAGAICYWNLYREFNFYSNDTSLSSADMKSVSEIADYLNRNPSLRLGIDGTAVSSGDQNINDLRVNAIRTALINAGVSPDEISTGVVIDNKDFRRKGRVAVLFTTD